MSTDDSTAVNAGMENLNMKDDVENQNPIEHDGSENVSAVNKKKNKKKKKQNKETEEKETEPVVENVLVPVEDNVKDASEEITCSFCKKREPTKRCSKRHPKCLKKMFCNETCESLAHEDKKAALVKKAASATAKAKKTNKVSNWKNTDSGQFWWHDQ